MQIAMGSKKRKLKASLSNSNKNKKNYSAAKLYSSKRATQKDSLIKDSTKTADYFREGKLAKLDTIIKINYQNLTDSSLNEHKKFIYSFIKRFGNNPNFEISLTDYYLQTEEKSKSVKPIIYKHITNIGVNRHNVFYRKSKQISTKTTDNYNNLLYLEIHFY